TGFRTRTVSKHAVQSGSASQPGPLLLRIFKPWSTAAGFGQATQQVPISSLMREILCAEQEPKKHTLDITLAIPQQTIAYLCLILAYAIPNIKRKIAT
ncbi:MAG: hypothetical protein ACLPJW_06425, partial [Rhodomicrobium sp.]